MRSRIQRAEARTVLRTAGTIMLLAGAVFLPPAASNAQARAPLTKVMRAPPVAPAQTQTDFAAMVERYGPAVVNISTAMPADQGGQTVSAPGLDSLDPDDPVYSVFRASSAPPPAPSTVPDAPRAVWGTGSGFIVSADGIVVTTAHVVNRAEQVTVTLIDRRQFKADVLAVDPQTDIALLQIEGATKLPVMRLGDSSHVRVGERVLAIGAPDGPQNAATSGLVSVTPHATADGNTFSFLETDIAAGPDNSGGPLLDSNGAVIGVNLQVYADAGPYRSLTLAIPIDAALKLRAQLRGQGKLAGGSLGIQTQDVDPGLAAAFGLPRATGALVTAVAPATHRGAANGLAAGDVITRINGKAIEHEADLTEYVAALQPGTKVALTLVRNKKPMTLTTVVVERRDNGTTAATARETTAGPGERHAIERLGLAVHALSDAERRSTGLPLGLVVDSATGAAANAGIQAGDVILSVNSELVETREALETAIERGGQQIALLVQRDNARSFVSLNAK
ncbi:Periplasmic pH-dependent serine endoprotease DegQ [Trinickia soli]|uniref:Probable periplasmic serine endoprotease DegP-like n=2 Tax=Trinickia soli TaxID=380675 RepID=A0A2N7W3X0_9BURK|nr:PDZ domain-containing protein [Paraburkholderia sp. T12-10]PMS24088.1 signaling protein [Trinickia soli]CAB3702436.1 Periplasmic pH-dependent serine endoprotease DegQ [Trinickia soli]